MIYLFSAARYYAAQALFILLVTVVSGLGADQPTNSSFVWRTNGPAVFRQSNTPPNWNPVIFRAFDHYLPGTLNYLVWTNFMAMTNGKSTLIWNVRTRPPGWPAKPPIVEWNTNCLLWGMRGFTAISPCWEDEGSPGQVPITALTRRHGYTRGHGMGPDGFSQNRKAKKVWFVTRDNAVVEATVSREVIRTAASGANRDYTILLFSKDLPASIEPMRALVATNEWRKYPPGDGDSPRPIFQPEQSGHVNTGMPGFIVRAWKPGDSGAPDLLPLPKELIFLSGRSTSGASAEMQADMDELCRSERLDPKKYQIQWLDLASYASY